MKTERMERKKKIERVNSKQTWPKGKYNGDIQGGDIYSPSSEETEAGASIVHDQPGLPHDKLSRQGERETGSEH